MYNYLSGNQYLNTFRDSNDIPPIKAITMKPQVIQHQSVYY